LARTVAILLTTAALVVVLVVGLAGPAGAGEPLTAAMPGALLAQEDGPVSPPVGTAGHQTGDPLYDSELPVAPVLGGTAVFLVLLSVVAVRRGWVI
jgi:hypothetical protein